MTKKRRREIEKILKEIESEASDMLGDLGASLNEFAVCEVAKRLKIKMSDPEFDKLYACMAVGVTFELLDEEEV